MTDIVPFQFPDTGNPVRAVMIDGVPFFVAMDVCAVVGIAKHRDAVAQLEDDERASTVVDTPGGPQRMTVVNEAGVYALMLISRSPRVKPFRRWITHEVLPALRRTGSYSVEARPQVPQTYAAALRELADTVERAAIAEARVAVLEPAAESWTTLASAEGDWSVREAAYILSREHGIDTGERRLFNTMRSWRMLDSRDIPYASHQRHLRLRPRSYTNRATGEECPAKPQVRITADGLAYLRRRFQQTT